MSGAQTGKSGPNGAPFDRFEVRVYYEDTDFSGNVYHAAYLKFMERARTEYLRSRGIHHSVLAKDGIAFVVRRMGLSFERSAHIDDGLEVRTCLVKLTGVRMILAQTIWRDDDRLIDAEVEVAIIGPAGRPMRLPVELRDLL